ncbi:hypothetical protein L1987_03114 [Smallanthus sonchifolius]|uniref:Uncharacterized protein n=1 Tax=Smallanthus sonchifolius TaxID=185202 RepID=A0ACB9K9V0_9ASTR|nr:hypothetical protein L1987_03114 [Smallanthus sonchifolius]
MVKMMLLTVIFMFILRSGHCQCSNASTSFRTNLRTLLDLLTKNAPLHDGYYEASVGNKPDQAFGILHCKANISKNDCANCLRYPYGILDECPENGKETLTTSCTMKFSHKNFFGSWSNFTIASFGGNGLDDPMVFSKGFSMMEDLASAVPDKPLMYQEAEIDVGVHGKRFGLAQCGRDLSKVSCRNCLEERLEVCRSYAHNRTGWVIVGIGCSMWYSNNISKALTPSNSELPPNVISGAQRCHGGNGITTIISMAIGATFTVFLATNIFQFA